MRRKKIRATKKNKEVIRKYKKEMTILDLCGDTNIKMTCSKCKETLVVRTHRPEAFTEDVKKNFVCLICEGRKR